MQFKKPIVDTSAIKEIANGVWVIPDAEHTPLVPNVGIITGERGTLIVDTGLGSENAKAVYKAAKKLSVNNPIYLTHTHCHPEHGFGANVISKEVTIIYNGTQWCELQEKGGILLKMFRELIPPVSPMLEGVEFIRPNLLYTDSLSLSLDKGLIVEFREVGGGHSRGDQVIIVHGEKSILFTGDLVEEKYFGVLGDHESHVIPWMKRLRQLEELSADIVVPGHGNVGSKELITNFRTYFEFAKSRINKLRIAGKLKEAEIAEQVGIELLTIHPDWGNSIWAKKTAEDLLWPARP